MRKYVMQYLLFNEIQLSKRKSENCVRELEEKKY